MTPPIIYNADPVTGEFIGTAYADPDPLTPGNWLLPAHAYFDAPAPAGPGDASVRDGDSWVVVQDHRGAVYSTETGAEINHQYLGVLPEGFTTAPRPSKAHRWSGEGWVLDPQLAAEQQRVQFKAQRADAVARITVMTSSGRVFDGDEISQGRMARAIIGLQAQSTGAAVTWVLADNTAVDVDLAELQEALTLAGLRQAELWIPPAAIL